MDGELNPVTSLLQNIYLSAKQQRERLLTQAIVDVKAECQYERFRDCSLHRQVNGSASQELKDISVNEMFEHITGQSMDRKDGY